MSVVYVLTTPMPEDGENAIVELIQKSSKWENDDYDFLEAKYIAEDASSKKLLDCKGGKIGNKANGSRINGSVNGSSNPLKGQIMFNKSFQDNDVAWKNLVSSSVLNNCGYKQVIESNKFVLSKHAFFSISKLNDSIPWHIRLGHVHFKRMQDMSKDGSILAFDMDIEKCKTCMLTKITKKPFHDVKRETEVLKCVETASHEGHDGVTSSKTDSRVLRVWGCSAVVRLTNPKLKLWMIGVLIAFSLDMLSIPRHSVVTEEVADQVLVQQLKPELCRSNRYRTPNSFGPECQLYLIEGTMDEKEAINDDMDSIIGNNTWVLVDLPPGCKPLGCKWIFKRKMKVDGTVGKFKPITIRLLISLALIHNLIIHQIDVKTTFLNDELDEEVDLTNEFLSSRFSMKDMGEADVILGTRIKHESNGISIKAVKIASKLSHYIEKALKKFNYFDCTLVSTLIDTSDKLRPNNGQAVSQLEYSRVIGCLTLSYIGYPLVLEGYINASWINNTEDNSSTSGWVFLLRGGVIAWASKKQTCITSSTMEYEFVALATAGKEAECLKNLIFKIPFVV
ncbi:zinc finger, CCHC-type containing protein [Tanacetum coccineum]